MNNKKLNLNGSWNLRCKELNLDLLAKVPGSVYQDLLNAGVIPDPFDQDNEYLVREYMNYDYSYERSFEISEKDIKKRIYLTFEGLDSLCSVYLNEEKVLESDNMHRKYSLELESINIGLNELKVLIHSPLKYILEKENTYPHKLSQAGDSVKGYIHLRKASYMFGWDWGPQLPDGGIWRDVYLEIIEEAKIDDLWIKQKHSAGVVELEILPTIVGASESIKLKYEIYSPEEEKILEIVVDQEFEKTVFEVEKPELWYPTGYGLQPLYRLVTTLYQDNEVAEEKVLSFGLRTVELEQIEDEYGESFTFAINGIKVFAKGSNYIPEDNLLGRTSYEKTYRLLEAAKLANHNMIRVWGGGIYPPDYFYDICDELGLLVWQDLMFACSIYPMDNEGFVKTMEEELKDNLIRIRNHPSLVLICGNNENETAIEHWHVPSLEISKEFYKKQYLDIIPKIREVLTPDIPYWRSSPASKELFKDTNSDNYGDMHYWGVWHNNEPFTNYRKYFPRFMSEFGLQSFPSLETIETFTRDEDRNIFSYVMEQHQKNKTANSKILDYIGKLFKYPKDFASLLYVSQAIQAEGIRYGVEHWRQNYGRCMGILYWQLNDCWPVASWSSIDYYHRWKILHYHAKKFYAPLLVSVKEEKNNAKIFITNDTLSDQKGVLTFELLDFDGNIIKKNLKAVTIKKQSSVGVAEVNIDYDRKTLEQLLLYVSLEVDEKIISENQVCFLPDKHLALKKCKIKYELKQVHEEFYLEFDTDTYAKFLEVKIKGEDIVFSDNYFHLIPSKKKRISFTSCKSLEEINNKLNIRTLVDTY